MVHESVLAREVISELNLKPQATVIDATVNGGGHSEAICRLLGEEGHVIGIDLDADALLRARKRIEGCKAKLTLINGSYKDLAEIAAKAGVVNVDGVLFDLGLSSNQLEESGRGFSFQRNEPLLMTFHDKPDTSNFTAREIVNEWDEGVIADILFGYGEERYARRIAKAIVERRKSRPIETTDDLVAIIRESTPKSYHVRKTHFATKTFQALRIAVNDEVEVLKRGLDAALGLVSSKGRIAVITFHSIEDRIVKQRFALAQEEGKGKSIHKKPIVPTPEEIKKNPRARSAKLRIFEVL